MSQNLLSGLSGLTAAMALAACAATPTLPSALQPAVKASPLMTVAASGVQVYECRAASRGVAPTWIFVAPEAELFDANGRRIGHHGAGPHWTADDGSRVVGRVLARADAPVAGAIPWLLLATDAGAARGVFSAVSHIQRINTVGGVAPAAGCNAERAGVTARIAYTADYRLFIPS
jgi:hypothetical protein